MIQLVGSRQKLWGDGRIRDGPAAPSDERADGCDAERCAQHCIEADAENASRAVDSQQFHPETFGGIHGHVEGARLTATQPTSAFESANGGEDQ